MARPAVALVGVSKTFGAQLAVDRVTLRVAPGTVHALLGGNGSGKSTLLKVLAGVHQADPGGEIHLGEVVHRAEGFTPADAARGGLRFVHQDLGLVDDLSVAENFALVDGYPRRRRTGFGIGVGVDWAGLRGSTARSLAAMGLRIDPRTPVGALRPSDRTLVAIARALRPVPGIASPTLVLDEPTASLPHDEVDRLLRSLQGFRAAGHGIVYVSHRLSEVLDLADVVTVLRDGRVVEEGPVGAFDQARIVALMTAPDTTLKATTAAASVTPGTGGAPAGEPGPGREALRLKGFGARRVRADLTLRHGEVLGLAGLLGTGRSTLLRAIFGDLPAHGELWLDGRRVSPRSPREAVRLGIALVPEDRTADGAFTDRSVRENLTAAVIDRYQRHGRLDLRTERADAAALTDRFLIRTPSPAVPLATLSGGNQQKVILARWLRRQPTVLLLDEPTQGVDAAARAEIHALIRHQVSTTGAAVVVSSDFEELEAWCDRVLVLRDGRIQAEIPGPRPSASQMVQLTQTDTEAAA